MKSSAESVEEYLQSLPEERQAAMQELRNVILEHLPEGFVETMAYGMIGYVVPHSIYPHGYHCDAKQPLPFINVASQKNFIAVYHMGLYANPLLMEWFSEEYPKHCKGKADMGKSCLRFKKVDQIPYKLIGELAGKMSAEEWVACYESNFKKK